VSNPRSRDDNSVESSSLFLFLSPRLNRRVVAATKAKQLPRIDDDVGSHSERVSR